MSSTKMLDSDKIGRAIRTLRKKAGMTQKELADQLFISTMAVSKWETGKSVPDTATLQNLALILDMDVDGLLDGTATHLSDRWRGILHLEHTAVMAETPLFDKPLIDYLLSYFLLAGVRDIQIVCTTRDRAYIHRRFQGGELLGIRLQCLAVEELAAWETLRVERSRDTDVMFISAPFFVYGVDLSRFFQRAMQHKNAVVRLASVVGSGGEKLREGFSNYEYQLLPISFFQAATAAKLGGELLISEAPLLGDIKGRLRMEPMDKGFVFSALQDSQDVERVSALVKIIQELGRYLIYCPPEIAWRRGMIDMETMKRGTAAFPEYREYAERCL